MLPVHGLSVSDSATQVLRSFPGPARFRVSGPGPGRVKPLPSPSPSLGTGRGPLSAARPFTKQTEPPSHLRALSEPPSRGLRASESSPFRLESESATPCPLPPFLPPTAGPPGALHRRARARFRVRPGRPGPLLGVRIRSTGGPRAAAVADLGPGGPPSRYD